MTCITVLIRTLGTVHVNVGRHVAPIRFSQSFCRKRWVRSLAHACIQAFSWDSCEGLGNIREYLHSGSLFLLFILALPSTENSCVRSSFGSGFVGLARSPTLPPIYLTHTDTRFETLFVSDQKVGKGRLLICLLNSFSFFVSCRFVQSFPLGLVVIWRQLEPSKYSPDRIAWSTRAIFASLGPCQGAVAISLFGQR